MTISNLVLRSGVGAGLTVSAIVMHGLVPAGAPTGNTIAINSTYGNFVGNVTFNTTPVGNQIGVNAAYGNFVGNINLTAAAGPTTIGIHATYANFTGNVTFAQTTPLGVSIDATYGNFTGLVTLSTQLPSIGYVRTSIKGQMAAGNVVNGLTLDVGFQIQSTIRLYAVFRAIGSNELLDPTTVDLFLSLPDSSISPTTVVRDAPGMYHCDILTTQHGQWNYKWQGSGSVDVTSPDAIFYVEPSQFIDG